MLKLSVQWNICQQPWNSLEISAGSLQIGALLGDSLAGLDDTNDDVRGNHTAIETQNSWICRKQIGSSFYDSLQWQATWRITRCPCPAF